MAKYVDGPMDGQKIKSDDFDKVDGPYPCKIGEKHVWGVYERSVRSRDRTWKIFGTEEEALAYIQKNQQNLYTLD
jgi:hypothetical protein